MQNILSGNLIISLSSRVSQPWSIKTWSSFDIRKTSAVDLLNRILAALGTPTEGPRVIEIELQPDFFSKLAILDLYCLNSGSSSSMYNSISTRCGFSALAKALWINCCNWFGLPLVGQMRAKRLIRIPLCYFRYQLMIRLLTPLNNQYRFWSGIYTINVK
jgi:hypothetical protein